MSLKDSIVPYTDVNNLVCPSKCNPHVRGSDNGPLFTSEYLVLAYLKGEPLDVDKLNAIKACIVDGYLRRAPDDISHDAPDDHYGVLAIRRILRLKFVVKLRPNCWQPALLYLSSPWFFFLSPLIALIILFSNPAGGNESNEILTWMLIQGTKRNPLCALAGMLWMRRKNIKKIFVTYFAEGHPFIDAVQ